MDTKGIGEIIKSYNPKSIEEVLKKLQPSNIGHISPYEVPEKDISSNFYAHVDKGIFIKEKIRGPEKTLWEFYMLYLCNKIFKKARKKIIEIKVPKPYFIDLKEKNLRIYMEFLPGLPIKKYSEKSKNYINERKIKINKKKSNLIEIIAYGLGAVERIKSYYFIFHGDMDFRHIMFDPESFVLGVVDFEKSFVYIPEYNIDKKLVEKAIRHERERVLAYLEDKFSHLEAFGKMIYFFEKGRDSVKLKNIKIENYLKEFYENYGFLPLPPNSVLERIKEVAEEKY
jgi:hypothetical protein